MYDPAAYMDDDEAEFEELFLTAEDRAKEPEDRELVAEIRRRLTFGFTSERIATTLEISALRRIAGL